MEFYKIERVRALRNRTIQSSPKVSTLCSLGENSITSTTSSFPIVKQSARISQRRFGGQTRQPSFYHSDYVLPVRERRSVKTTYRNVFLVMLLFCEQERA